MRKTLLIAAVALAASIISSEAQVYSQNIVGYINLTIPNAHFALLANQLDTGSNTLDNVFASGPVSGQTYANYWNGTSFQQFEYYNAADSPDGNVGWYDYNTGAPCTNYLSPSQGVFVRNTSGSTMTITTVGTVKTGTNFVTIANGLHIYSVPVPLAGQSLDSLGFPGNSGNDYYLKWTGTNYYQLIYYSAADSPDGNVGWYDYNTSVYESTNSAVWPNAGDSFFIRHNALSTVWTNVFNP
jgi:hypothetical protein